MTTYGTYDIDSVPAPSDLELEPRIGVEPCYTFNAWNTLTGVTLDRARWHRYVRRYIGQEHVLSDAQWWWFYRAFLHSEDADDLHDTHADALV